MLRRRQLSVGAVLAEQGERRALKPAEHPFAVMFAGPSMDLDVFGGPARPCASIKTVGLHRPAVFVGRRHFKRPS